MECPICFREYHLSFSSEAVLPKVATCGHSICADCCSQLPDNKNCPCCNRANAFQWQSRCFLAEDCLAAMEGMDQLPDYLLRLKQLSLDLKETSTVIKRESEKKGLISWIKFSRKNKEIKKLRKDILALIDLNTAIIRPKLLVSNVSPPSGILRLEVRAVSSLEVGVHAWGQPAEIGGCIWKMYARKDFIEGQYFFSIGFEMETCVESTKRYDATGRVLIISQRNTMPDRQIGLRHIFTAPKTIAQTRPEHTWDEIVSSESGYVLNDRIYVLCNEWSCKAVGK